MQRRRFPYLLSIASSLFVSACCLPPVSHLSEDEAKRFAQTFEAPTFLARIHFSTATSAMNAGGVVPVSMLPTITERSSVQAALHEAGYEVMALGGSAATTLGLSDGSQVAWVLVTEGAVAAAAKDPLLRSEEDDPSTLWGRAHRQAGHLRNLLKSDQRLSVLDHVQVYVEPNLEQAYPYDRSWTCPFGSSTGPNVTVNGRPDGDWPRPDSQELDWHLDDDRTQLRSASDNTWNAQKRIRIVHLDTGFDVEHVTKPANLDEARERNVLIYPPLSGADSAADPGNPEGMAGWACFNGHGTGTLSLLSGPKLQTAPGSSLVESGPLGAAPNATIIPVRIADSVIHLYSMSMGDGIFYAARPMDEGGAGADVISISAGGLPSQYWADAVNYAYEHGVVIAAATGDNIHDLPVRGTLWPARFQRVIAVAGATSKDQPYDRQHSNATGKWMVEGNYGPDYVMRHALAAYTPNTAWAEWGKYVAGQTHAMVDPNGRGTSAATPQVAGAAALYLANYPTLASHDWLRAESARQALFQTARLPKTTDNDLRYFGNGIIRAQVAIAKSPGDLGNVQKLPVDRICSPLLEAITGVQLCDSDRAQMLAVEMAQLTSSDAQLEYLNWDDPASIGQGDAAVAMRTPGLQKLANDNRASKQLRDALWRRAQDLKVDLR